MDLVEKLREEVECMSQDEINEIYCAIEDLTAKIKKKQTAKFISTGASLEFDNGTYIISIADLVLRGKHARYVDFFDKKTIFCKWGNSCASMRDTGACDYFHPETGEQAVISHRRPSDVMKQFLEAPPEILPKLYSSSAELRNEILALKVRVLDLIIRLLWVSQKN